MEADPSAVYLVVMRVMVHTPRRSVIGITTNHGAAAAGWAHLELSMPKSIHSTRN